MIILGNRRPISETLHPYLRRGASIFFIFSAVAAIASFILLYQWPSHKNSPAAPLTPNYESFSQGIFSLRRESAALFLPLQEELSIIAQNSRPDAEKLESKWKQPCLLLGLRGNPSHLSLRSGQPVCLSWEKGIITQTEWHGPPAPVALTFVPSSLKLQSLILNGKVFLQASSGEEKLEFLLKTQGPRHETLIKHAHESNWYQSLKTACFWQADQFLSLYGKLSKGTARIGFGQNLGTPTGNSSIQKILLASEGDFLIFRSGQWHLGSLEQAQGVPLARVKGKSDTGFVLDVWDETGFFQETISLNFFSQGSFKFTNPATLFTSIKARNSSEISCMMGKRRIVLKAGDWWLKKADGWHRINKKSEIDDFLHFRNSGELLVIEGLDSYQGKAAIKGYQFDPLRQIAATFQIPVTDTSKKTPRNSLNGMTKRTPKQGNAPRPLPVSRRPKEAISS